ncbi:MAG TPA: glycosyltransferase family 1 protein [Actinomycetota bacterium]|jgi:glycosyltransferase involved in cell wall biosynthesis
MRVLIDARPALDPRPTGVGHYVRQIVRHLPAADPEGRYAAWYLHARGALRPRRFFPDVANLAERATRVPSRLYHAVAWRVGLPRVEWLTSEFDVLLATNFVSPPTSRRVALVVHDLAFRLFPESAPHHGPRWTQRFEEGLARAEVVIVPSDATRRDLLDLYAVDPARVAAIHHGLDAHDFHPAPLPEVARARRAFGVGEAPYALFLGALESRKNLETLVRAFQEVPAPAKLVIAGGPVRWDPAAAERLDRAIEGLPPGVGGRVTRTGYVGDADKVALLTGATVVAYPSRYEGFGFPVLEGFAAGVPVLASNVSSLPEVAGDAAVLVDPDDPVAIGKELARLFDDEDLRNVLRAAGHARVASFTWEATARATAAALHRVVPADLG